MFGGLIPLWLWMTMLGLALIVLVVTLRQDRSKMLTFSVAAAAPVAVLLLASQLPEPGGTRLGSAGIALVGVHILVFRETWIAFNQRFSGSLIPWHRKYKNSRFLILALGIGVIGLSVVALLESSFETVSLK
ncbi:MAG TPA: hypothetical protein VND22_05105 [Actinomycetota bacterium]|nr:hypothetical protein [Actinomycetota bacterium]